METAKRKCRAVMHKTYFPIDGYNYNVQLWYEWKNTFVYAGNGKYFKTEEEALKYAEENSTEPIEKNY